MLRWKLLISGVWQRQKSLQSFHISPHHHLHLHHYWPVKHNTNKASLWHTLTDNFHIIHPHLTQGNHLTAPERTISYCLIWSLPDWLLHLNASLVVFSLSLKAAQTQRVRRSQSCITVRWRVSSSSWSSFTLTYSPWSFRDILNLTHGFTWLFIFYSQCCHQVVSGSLENKAQRNISAVNWHFVFISPNKCWCEFSHLQLWWEEQWSQ